MLIHRTISAKMLHEEQLPQAIPRPVWFLGWTSLFTDAASEVIYPLLPVYLSRVLGASATSLGIIEGVAEGVNSILKVISGWWSDRRSRRRPLVILGYTISSFARPLIALTTTWPQVLAIRALDRTGKGIRGAPRDALLTRFATSRNRGRIFGFHRSMDHTGAIVGPVLATVFLYFLPDRYRLLFALTAIPGAIAVAMLFLVREDGGSTAGRASRSTPGNEASQSTPGDEASRIRPGRSASGAADGEAIPLPGRLYAVLAVILLFSLGNSADAFLLLRLSDALGSATYVPLLWAAHHVVKAGLSTWGGGLSDRVGRKQVIVAGWMIYAVVYLGFAWSTTSTAFVAWFLIYGVYFALTEGAEKALVADLTPLTRHGSAFGLYNAALGAGALVASVMFGYIYDQFGAPRAFTMGAMLAGVAALALLFVPSVKMDSSNAAYSRNQ
jgi:MFS family permease